MAIKDRPGATSPVSAGRDGTVIACKVVPSASKTEIAEIGVNEVRVRIAAPPVDGKANKELIRFFSKLLSVSKSSVQILKGETGKNKKVFIAGANPADVEKIIKKGDE